MLELLLGLSLTLVLTAALFGLATSWQTRGVREADRMFMVLQSRVAAARLEKDLRMASAAGCKFTTLGPVLEATPRQVVFFSGGDRQSEPLLVEWEIDGSRLMRRWGPCPGIRPAEYSHTLYVDNKTMLDGLDEEAQLSYLVGGDIVHEGVSPERLPYVAGVVLIAAGEDAYGTFEEGIWVRARVGW